MKFMFYYEDLIGGCKHKEAIEAKNFREARGIFFGKHQHTPHKIIAIWNHDTNEKLM